MVSKLLLQCAAGAAYNAELQATWPQHSAYAAAHGYDFWHLQGWRGSAITWARFLLTLRALEAGYDFVAYLDTDAVIVDPTADLMDALPVGGHLGAVYYDYGDVPGGQPAHWQVGAFYVRNTALAGGFLADLLLDAPPRSYLPGPEPWWTDALSDQTAFNAVLTRPRWQDVPQRIDYRWNVTHGFEHGVPPVVLHLAGLRGTHRAAFLRQIIAGQQHKTEVDNALSIANH